MTTKKCPRCGCTDLVRFSSLNEKQCAECNHRFKWGLDKDQKPLITSSKDRG